MRERPPHVNDVDHVVSLAREMLWHLRKNRLEQAQWTQDKYYEALERALRKGIDILPLTRVWWTVTEPETVWGRGMA